METDCEESSTTGIICAEEESILLLSNARQAPVSKGPDAGRWIHAIDRSLHAYTTPQTQ